MVGKGVEWGWRLRIQRHRLFVYGAIRLRQVVGELVIEAEIRPRANSRPTCSGCSRLGPGYDSLPGRRFEFIPLWGIPVFFVYAMRRVDCLSCGVRVESIPWAEGKNHLTTSYAWFLARWAKRMSWKEVAGASAPTAGMTLRAINDSWQAGAGDLGARREPSLIRLVPRARVS